MTDGYLSGRHAKIADDDNAATNITAEANNLTINGKMVLKWDVVEVLQWLNMSGFGDFKPNFEHHCINGSIISRLNDNLLKEMGIDNVGRRLQLQNEIQKVQVVARQQWRSTILWASEEFRMGPCFNMLPYGFPCCFAACVGKPSIYKLTNAKLNMTQNTKLCNYPFMECCGFSMSSQNIDLTEVIDVDSFAQTALCGDAPGTITVATKSRAAFQIVLKSDQITKVTAMITLAKEEANIMEASYAMQMFR